MSLLSWNEGFSIGIPVMDGQHKKWINIINELHESLVSELSMDVRSKIFQDVINYTIFHFTEEEKLMREIDYPDYLSHKAVHLNFTSKINKLKNEFTVGEIVLQTEIMTILKNWLTDHIMNVDKEYAIFKTQSGAF